MKRTIRKLILLGLIAAVAQLHQATLAQEKPAAGPLALARAVMCESIQEYAPVNPAVVFSIDRGRISCFTEFDPVPAKTVIHHKWYRRDSLVTSKKLTINPPRWSSFTSVHLRDTDKGPWRVEVTDADDKLMRTLRFSITD